MRRIRVVMPFAFLGLHVLALADCTREEPASDPAEPTESDGEPAKGKDETSSPELVPTGHSAGERDAGRAVSSASTDAGSSASTDAGARMDAARAADLTHGPEAGRSDATQPTRADLTDATRCQSRAGAKRGRSEQTVNVGGAQRSFVYYAPEGLDANEPAPLVILPHGTNMSGQAMFDVTEYAKLADREKFVAIFPDGVDAIAPWNIGFGVCGLGAFVAAAGEDQAFVEQMIEFADRDQCIDRDHVFMTGFSMGGYFSNETGCTSSVVRAVAPHSGGTHDLRGCTGTRKPVLIFHFTSDALIDYGCGADARDQWVARNGCKADQPEVVPVKGGSCEYYQGCPADGQVAFCTFEEPLGGDGEIPTGHGWSGGVHEGYAWFAAIQPTESANELGWAFFKKYAW